MRLGFRFNSAFDSCTYLLALTYFLDHLFWIADYYNKSWIHLLEQAIEQKRERLENRKRE
jgi:hypothetical protein